jgi:hypothetical protein
VGRWIMVTPRFDRPGFSGASARVLPAGGVRSTRAPKEPELTTPLSRRKSRSISDQGCSTFRLVKASVGVGLGRCSVVSVARSSPKFSP